VSHGQDQANEACEAGNQTRHRFEAEGNQAERQITIEKDQGCETGAAR
jgi:hypothetical protein